VRRAEVRHRHRLAGDGVAPIDEGLASGRLEARPGLGVGLEVQALADSDRDEQIVDVQAVAAEHAARPRLPGTP